MFHLINSINYARKYSSSISPIVARRMSECRQYTKRIKKLSVKSNALEALDKSRLDAAVSSICVLYPGVDIPLAADVLFSFQAVVQYLNSICIHNSANTEPFIRVIFSSLKDALNIRSDSFEKYFTFFPSKDDDGYLSILVEKCRQKVRTLPSFDVIRDHIAASLALFIELQTLKYSSYDDIKEINFINWSSAHGQKYSDLSHWEFCMAVDSTLDIQLLLALASMPNLEEQRLENLNNAFFPWICGIQKMLEGFINHNEDFFSDNSNFNFYYNNLKEYENKVSFFIDKALEVRNPASKYLRRVIKLLLSIYVTHPKAEEGMNKITARALAKAGGGGMFLYVSALKMLRAKKLL